ncbi:Uncharacterised protein [Vibrio cholerae]|nr:Uncharacterised protein [Vibrio cholerae]
MAYWLIYKALKFVSLALQKARFNSLQATHLFLMAI